MPKRVNKAIELLEQDQPVYYTGSHTGANLTYEAGRRRQKHGQTTSTSVWSMVPSIWWVWRILWRGLVDGGPTNSGHRTPAVVVELPMDGSSLMSSERMRGSSGSYWR